MLIDDRCSSNSNADFIDYNGTGAWSREAILERYSQYAHTLKLTQLRDLTPQVYPPGSTNPSRIFSVMDEVIPGIEAGDLACIKIGIEYIEEDQHFVFGRTLKSNTARALRRATLSEEQAERVRQRIVNMLIDGLIFREYREYAKLLRKLGFEEWWPYIERNIDRQNPFVMRYYYYFDRHLRLGM
jgi:hypothetical protein